MGLEELPTSRKAGRELERVVQVAVEAGGVGVVQAGGQWTRVGEGQEKAWALWRALNFQPLSIQNQGKGSN